MAILSRRAVRVLCGAMVVALPAMAHVVAQVAGAGAADIKAAFVYNFAKYVEWPEGTLVGDFHVCVVEDQEFVRSLDTIITGETIAGRPVTRRTPANAAAARTCQILFIGDIEPERVDTLLTALQGAPVLTVSDAPEFLDHRGMILFVRDGDRIRFDVDVVAAQRAGLTISSRLLRVARRVLPGETNPQ